MRLPSAQFSVTVYVLVHQLIPYSRFQKTF